MGRACRENASERFIAIVHVLVAIGNHRCIERERIASNLVGRDEVGSFIHLELLHRTPTEIAVGGDEPTQPLLILFVTATGGGGQDNVLNEAVIIQGLEA
jgi:hypothetical protein